MVRIALIFAFLVSATPVWADFQAGEDAYNRGDYDTALREWLPLAEQGDADAQFNLAALYMKGQGVPQDVSKSFELITKAAWQGHLPSLRIARMLALRLSWLTRFKILAS